MLKKYFGYTGKIKYNFICYKYVITFKYVATRKFEISYVRCVVFLFESTTRCGWLPSPCPQSRPLAGISSVKSCWYPSGQFKKPQTEPLTFLVKCSCFLYVTWRNALFIHPHWRPDIILNSTFLLMPITNQSEVVS